MGTPARSRRRTEKRRNASREISLADLLASLKLEEQNVMKILDSQSAEDDC